MSLVFTFALTLSALARVHVATPVSAFGELSSTNATGGQPVAVAAGDLDSDGRADIVVANASDSSVSVLMGHGDGTFGAKTDFATGAGPRAVLVADLDHDGRYDLVVANASAHTVSALLGHGDGSFGPASDFDTGSGPSALAAGDLNADAALDVIVVNAGADSISVLLGNGDGTFRPKDDYATAAAPSGAIVGDFNEDGTLDVMTADRGASSLSFFPGIGDGTLGTRAVVSAGSGPTDLAAGDFNADGVVDLAVAHEISSTVSILLGHGLGTFATTSDIAVGSRPRAVVLADVNADGRLDAVVANSGSDSISVLLGDGTGALAPRQDMAAGSGAVDVAPADFDRDGRLDFAVANQGADTVSVLLGEAVAQKSTSAATVAAVVTAASKPYDGTTTATLVSCAVTGPVTGDAAAGDAVAGHAVAGDRVACRGTATFDSPDAGTSKTVTVSGLTLTGAQASHYTLSETTATTSAGIVARSVSATVSVAEKRYDGTTAATLTSCAVSDVIAGDSVACTGTAAFDSANAGANNAVTVSHLELTGTAAANYALAATTATTTGRIVANRPPTVTNPGTQSAFRGVTLTRALAAVDADGDPLTWSAAGLPPGTALDPSTGVLSSTPTTIGRFTSTITVSDGWDPVQVSFEWSVASPLPEPATPLTPSDSIETVRPTFSWAAVPAASYYALSIADAGTGSPGLAWFTPVQAGCASGSSTCTVAAPRALVPGLVSWKVITWNPYGYGQWSTTATVVVSVPDPTTPAPTPVAPSGFIAVRTPTYTWQAVSGDSLWYQVSVTDVSGTVRDFWYTPAVACTATPCRQTPNVMLPIGAAQWRVRAFSTSGAGAWSAPVSFDAADPIPPRKATLLAPDTSVSTSTPTFTWNAVLGTSYYLLRLVDRDNVNVERWYRPANAGCPSGTGICTASLGALKPGPANWRVLTWNVSGYGPWSDTRDFVVDLADRVAPTLDTISPTAVIATPNPTYTWTAAAEVTAYRLSIRNNEGQPAYSWYTPAAAGCGATPTCSARPQEGLRNGTGHWQVQAWTTLGSGPWTAPVALTVSLAVPPSMARADRPASAVKMIEYGWDTPGPQFVRDHIGDMERRPFDGVVMRLPHGGGDVFRPEAWDADTLGSQLAILREIQWQAFDSNFLAMYATSSMDWYDDDDWRVVLQHAAFMARAARAGRSRGLMFDPEPYGASPWTYAQQAHATVHTFGEYEVVVRERGRAFMRALQQEYPGLDVLTFYSYSYFLRAGAAPDLKARETALKNQAWGLLPAFLDGMLDVADSDTHIIDGQAQSYYSERPEDFAKGAADVRERAFPYVGSELWDKYARHVEGGQPLYWDWIFGYFKRPTPSLGDGSSSERRARLAEHHAYYAMKSADRYVWVYSEKMNWWTGENLPPGAEDALRSARRKFQSGESLGFDVTSIPQGAP
jgi:hypothetical protein